MVNGHLQKPYKAQFHDGRHPFSADLDSKFGGEDSAPNPHELLEAALVGCTLQTIQLYGARKGWDIGSTEVVVKFVSEGAEVVLSRTIKFDLSLNEEQKTRLTEIANKCPIHKALLAPTKIETQIIS
ncbi:MAG: OsmC family protein [Bacteriovoracaceae bacterium]|nr:OsmC family protein [Bacteriovoracaceae bacterium]